MLVATPPDFTLHLRSWTEAPAGSGRWEAMERAVEIPGNRLALLLCDVWDHHWCRGAEARCAVLAERMARVVEAVRRKGVQIIHAPSDCMAFYAGTPQRAMMANLTILDPPPARAMPDPPLPIDDSDMGCDDDPPCDREPPDWPPWTRQHAAIRIVDGDAISADGAEVFSLLKSRGIDRLLIMGVHTNMCVLNRSFAIKQMTRWYVDCALVRDLTDTMYNHRMRPFVTHDEGTALVVEHIERHWCPTLLSRDLVA